MGEVVDPSETRFAALDTSVEDVSNVSELGLPTSMRTFQLHY